MQFKGQTGHLEESDISGHAERSDAKEILTSGDKNGIGYSGIIARTVE
jgi:hypothetical protein